MAREDITALLAESGRGDAAATERLTEALYPELHKLAERYMRSERPDHTLQPTALVNEAYLRLVDQHDVRWQNRAHFLAVAARIMRRVLVDHARRRHRHKRDPGVRVTLDEASATVAGPSLDLVALDQELERLAALDSRHARVAELRLFGGLGAEEIAAVLGVSAPTVRRDWAFARAWLGRELRESNE